MTETQMDRFEGLLTQLVTMVGHTNQSLEELKQDVGTLKQDVSTLKEDVSTLKEDVSTLKEDVSTLKQDVSELKQRMTSLEIKQEEQHQELLSKFDSLKVDQDIAWAKIAENERDIERIKQHINV